MDLQMANETRCLDPAGLGGVHGLFSKVVMDVEIQLNNRTR